MESSAAAAFDNWVTLRDRAVVRQEQDFSCGLAALATVLTFDFGRPVKESQLLEAWRRQVPGGEALLRRRGASFTELAELARSRGLRAAGVALTPEALERLAAPAILYLEHGGLPHYVVLRGVTARGGVHIADPSFGNRVLSAHVLREQFTRPGSERGHVLLLGRAAGEPAPPVGTLTLPQRVPRLPPPLPGVP